jgi:hypothetical protein
MTPACAIAALRTRPPVPSAATSRSTRPRERDRSVPAQAFPFPWFESILKSGDCNSRHIASLFDRTNGLYRDLQRKSITPAFSWITPNMCSDGHDAVCHGNNLSGGFFGPNTPRAPKNYTGGLYSADLFLKHVVPEIEKSAAFKDGGLIDITFDEGYATFTYTANSFANSKRVRPNAATSIADASAAETLFGRRVHFEPTGPNTPLAKDAHGNELYPGPGFNSYIDRPSNCVQQQLHRPPAGTCILGGGQNVPAARPDAAATAAPGSSTIADNAAVATDPGRSVTGTGIPAGALVGTVTDTPVNATAPNGSGGFVDIGSFTLVDASGRLLRTTAAVSGVVLGARTPASDPLYDARDATTGGGDTGSVLISPYIRPHTTSTVFYNHYSWLRTMEDLFSVGRTFKGLDGQGHIGYAAQRGPAPFGADVFNHHRDAADRRVGLQRRDRLTRRASWRPLLGGWCDVLVQPEQVGRVVTTFDGHQAAVRWLGIGVADARFTLVTEKAHERTDGAFAQRGVRIRHPLAQSSGVLVGGISHGDSDHEAPASVRKGGRLGADPGHRAAQDPDLNRRHRRGRSPHPLEHLFGIVLVDVVAEARAHRHGEGFGRRGRGIDVRVGHGPDLVGER